MQILKASYLISSPDVKDCPEPDRPEYAFIGRSNVGKSSLINMLCSNDKLAKTSASPGKTQLINHFAIESTSDQTGKPESWYLVDLPGYGYAKVSINSRRRWEQMIEHYLKERENLINVFVLIDSRHTPQKIDLEFIGDLIKWKVPFTLLFTKADKEKQSIVSKNVHSFLDKLKGFMQFLPMHVVTSARKKIGRDRILNAIAEMNDDTKDEEIDTG